MTQGGYQVIIILPMKSKMAAAKKQWFLRFLYWTESSPPSFKVQGLQMTINKNKNHHQDPYLRETIPDKFVFFSKLVRQKKSIGWANTCMYASEICAEGIFVTFPWWLKMWKVGQK